MALKENTPILSILKARRKRAGREYFCAFRSTVLSEGVSPRPDRVALYTLSRIGGYPGKLHLQMIRLRGHDLRRLSMSISQLSYPEP
jgi:hypothetical protein